MVHPPDGLAAISTRRLTLSSWIAFNTASLTPHRDLHWIVARSTLCKEEFFLHRSSGWETILGGAVDVDSTHAIIR